MKVKILFNGRVSIYFGQLTVAYSINEGLLRTLSIVYDRTFDD